MENIKFSIVVPAYNIQDYIEKCLDSILEQTYKNYEIIVVNDGSTDNTKNIIDEYAKENIKIVHKENGGLSSARNEGVKYVEGDYIWFIDGDDYIEPNALELLYKKTQEEKYDVITFSYYYDYIDKKINFIDRFNVSDKNTIPLICNSAWSKIYNTKFYLENKFEFLHGKIYEDLALIPYIMVKAKSIGVVDNAIYNYVQREGSIMNFGKKFKANRDNKFDALNELIGHFKRSNLYEEYIGQLEYLVIRHLILVYSTEILPFTKDIYKNRCHRALEYISNINKKWYKNKYLKQSPITSKIYVWLFRKRLFLLCKLILKIKKGM